MNREESMSSRIASGEAVVTSMTAWWPRHSAAILRYALERQADADEAVVGAAQDSATLIAGEWEQGVPCAAKRRAGASLGIMTEHTALEVNLIEAVKAGDPQAIERAYQKLMDNAAAHSGRYAKALSSFPKGRFDKLMRDHIALLVEWLKKSLETDPKALEECERRRDENTAALASFTAEWF